MQPSVKKDVNVSVAIWGSHLNPRAKKNGKDYEWGNRVVVRIADDGASDDPVKILMMLMMIMTKMMRKKLTNSGDAD